MVTPAQASASFALFPGDLTYDSGCSPWQNFKRSRRMVIQGTVYDLLGNPR